MLVPMIEILNKAKKDGYGVLAPNVHNENTTRAAIEAAVELESPLIIDVLPFVTKDLVSFGKIASILANDVRIPIALNLDHGDYFECCIQAIRGGFTSIMVDRANLPFEENIREVAYFKKICTPIGVTVEAEIGQICEGSEYQKDREVSMTDPSVVKEFVERSGADCLAVSIGMAHGVYDSEPVIDFDRLIKIRNEVDIPLVFHGGSFSGDENIAKACRLGTQKVNMGTDAYMYGMKLLKENWEEAEANRIRRAEKFMMQGYKERVIHYMQLTGQVGKAW
jgi:fructose-bisphosphate aldolase, class II